MRYRSIIKQLRRYAHQNNPDCRLKGCPEFCYPKHENLDLDTAIAWEVADIIEDEDYPYKKERIESLSCVLFLHKEKYPKLWKIIGYIYQRII